MKEVRNINIEAEIGLNLCERGELDAGISHLMFAAEGGHLDAMTNLGHAFELKCEYEEAIYYSKIAADFGSPVALSNLSLMYRKGEGVAASADEAANFGVRLLELGYIDEGYSEIASSYIFVNDENQKDFQKAFENAYEGAKEVMKTRPNEGKKSKCVELLAFMYDFGIGVEENKKEAAKYYEYSAACGSGYSYFNLASIYAYSEELELKDIDKAIRYFNYSAETGYGDGYYGLGYLYHKGIQEKQDFEKAITNYIKAIEIGNGEEHYQDAINNLREISPELLEKVLISKRESLSNTREV